MSHANRKYAALLALQGVLYCFCGTASADVLSDALASMASNSWKKINLNRYQDVWTPAAQRPTYGSPDTNISAWSGAAWDSKRKDLLIWGGDQVGLLQDSEEGNEFYTFETATGLWKRGSLPSRIAVTNGIVHAVDGIFSAPTSGESWDNVVYLENVDRVAVIGVGREGQTFKALDGTATGPYFWDPAKADPAKVSGTTGSQVNPSAFPNVLGGEMWQNRDTFPPDTGLALRGVTGYVNTDGKDVVYFSGQSDSLWRYTVQGPDPASDTWELIGRRPWSGVDGEGSGAVDPVRQIFVKTLTENSLGFWDVSASAISAENREVEIIPVLPSGAPATDFRDFGLQYDPVLKAFLLWGGDSDVWQLDPPANLDPDGDGINSEATGWTLRRLVPSGSGPTVPSVFTGVFGKWVYLPEERAYIGVIDPIAGDVFLYKPAYNDSSSVPEVVLTADPVTVLAGGMSQLTWRSTNATTCQAGGGWTGTKPTSGSATIGPITTATEYSLSCTGSSGTVVSRVVVMVEDPVDPPTLMLSATPTAVASGGHASLKWTSSGANACTGAGGPWTGTKPTQGMEAVGPLSSSTAFTLSCTGTGGTTTLAVTVNIVPVPTVRLLANPDSVSAGGSSQLTWSSIGANSCQASGGWNGSMPTDGSAAVGPLATSTEFSLSCTGLSGTTVESVLVTVVGTVEPPTLALSATPTAVALGGHTSLEWTSSAATACAASGGPWAGAKPTQGSETVGPLTAATAFTLSCTGLAGTTTQSVVVDIVAAPIVEFSASPVSVAAGEQSNLTWAASGASTCSAGGGWDGTKSTSGSVSSGPLSSSREFELECSGTGGVTRVSKSVTVLPTSGPTSGNPRPSGGGGTADFLLGLGLAGLGLGRRRRARKCC